LLLVSASRFREKANPALTLATLLAVIWVLVVSFAALYYANGSTHHANLTCETNPCHMSRWGAIYFTIGTLSTSGTGNIAPVRAARAIQGIQLILNMAVILFALTAIVSRFVDRTSNGKPQVRRSRESHRRTRDSADDRSHAPSAAYGGIATPTKESSETLGARDRNAAALRSRESASVSWSPKRSLETHRRWQVVPWRCGGEVADGRARPGRQSDRPTQAPARERKRWPGRRRQTASLGGLTLTPSPCRTLLSCMESGSAHMARVRVQEEICAESVDERRRIERRRHYCYDMDAAVASLFGAFIGGSTVAASNFGLDAVRTKRERSETDRKERAEGRRAGRLIAEELGAGRRLLSRDVEARSHSWEPPGRQLPTAAWTVYRADFAQFASADAWIAVAEAYAHFDEMNWHVAGVVEEDHWVGSGPEHPLERRSMGPRTAELFTAALEAVDLAVAALRPMLQEKE
jgi:hypothetical protein